MKQFSLRLLSILLLVIVLGTAGSFVAPKTESAHAAEFGLIGRWSVTTVWNSGPPATFLYSFGSYGRCILIDPDINRILICRQDDSSNSNALSWQVSSYSCTGGCIAWRYQGAMTDVHHAAGTAISSNGLEGNWTATFQGMG